MLYDAYGRQVRRSIGFIREYRVEAISETKNSDIADAQSSISFEAEEVYEDYTPVTPTAALSQDRPISRLAM